MNIRTFTKAVLMILLSCAGINTPVSGSDWSSPHPLTLETKARATLLPFPKQVTWEGVSEIPAASVWSISKNANKMPMVKTAWESLIKEVKGKGKTPYSVKLIRDKEPLPEEARAEGYKLSVTAQGATITAASEAGFFNAIQTLRQLTAGKKLPLCEITDWPAFAWRGYMQDCGRNFRSVERLKKELDMAAQLKVNLFHWHLTDYPAWHIQCKSHPELNSPKHRTRDLHDTYTYEQIREVCKYAAKRNIRIIPELDMPGHSAYFNRAFGFKMHTEKGMKIVGELLDEFCREIPADMCPIIHFGADEVRIPNAGEFVGFVTKKLQSHNRTPMQWASNRDLPVGDSSIEQRWGEGPNTADKSIVPERITRKAFDSTMGYTNLLDPAMLVRRYFFMRPCGVAKGDELRLGTIMCIWPDGKVDNKDNIPGMCSMWPGMCAMAERAWVGGGANGDALPLEMPAPDTEAHRAYCSFEKRMNTLRKRTFKSEAFPFWPESNVEWTVVEPVPSAQAESTRKAVLAGETAELPTRKAYCANLYFRTRPDTGYLGMFMNAKPGNTVWAVTTIKSPKAGQMPFMIGFDAPARSNRRWTGVPNNGDWSQAGTRIWVNGKEVQNPRRYRLAGQKALKGNQWNFEEPLDPEEVWWVQDETSLPLKKGKNTIVIEQPYIGEHQSWGISLIPLFRVTDND
ncbi:MAG: beta-N-acetylhexosaminidase [Akkermansia sp.]|nr:beta-N-acetylhexosaminidase [Akkermansia sp.]